LVWTKPRYGMGIGDFVKNHQDSPGKAYSTGDTDGMGFNELEFITDGAYTTAFGRWPRERRRWFLQIPHQGHDR